MRARDEASARERDGLSVYLFLVEGVVDRVARARARRTVVAVVAALGRAGRFLLSLNREPQIEHTRRARSTSTRRRVPVRLTTRVYNIYYINITHRCFSPWTRDTRSARSASTREKAQKALFSLLRAIVRALAGTRAERHMRFCTRTRLRGLRAARSSATSARSRIDRCARSAVSGSAARNTSESVNARSSSKHRCRHFGRRPGETALYYLLFFVSRR